LMVLPQQIVPTLETLIVAGEACPADLVSHWAQDRSFFNAYGPTEATVCASIGACRAGLEPSIGRPIDNTQVYLLDQHLQPVPRGVSGEIYIGGIGLARGYLNRTEVTAERFIPHPFSAVSGARLYKTGDLARYLPDGNIEFLGRVDQQVKVRGYRIELGEIETVLEQHPDVIASVVVVHEELVGDKRLVAYVVAREAEATSSSELRLYLQQRLPDYMLPSFFVMLEALPLLPNGKVDRRALPHPNSITEERSEEDVLARSPIEDLLAILWMEVLGKPMRSISENFFEAGGHSLLATQLIARVCTVMQVELSLQSMFEAPTVAELAQEIERVLRSGQEVDTPPLEPTPRQEELALSFAQQRLWFLDQLEPGNTAYTIPTAVRLNGRLEPKVLEQSVKEIVRRHESLRTTFHTREDRPVQVIGPVGEVGVPLAELSDLLPARREVEALRLAQQEAGQPFDLARGPLVRTTLVRLSKQEHVLLLSMHHIISDGWSMQVFVRELSTLYNAFAQGRPSPLPDLPIQYADFAAWQRHWLQGPVLEAQLDYWSRQLAGATPLALPTDRPRPAMQSYRGASHSFVLPASLSQALKTLSQQEGVTLFMTLLAAFQTLLARWTGQSDIVVGTDIANRTRLETEALIGFFVNLLVLRANVSGTLTFRELLTRVRAMVLGAYAHQDTPFEMLVERLLPEHSLDRMPLVQALFVLQNMPLSHTALSEVDLRPFGNETTTAKFDLAVFLFEGSEGLRGGVIYSTDLFEASTIATMMSRFEVLLHNLMASPDTPIDAIEIYTEAERARQVERAGASRRRLRTVKGEGIDLASEKRAFGEAKGA
ncbi:MAG TPA: condensation domain-containing protein, partial [Ktedonobacteraceae bacterium]|nr:condensation domain-containing protein [Ktedonobacteraceae bacterium]